MPVYAVDSEPGGVYSWNNGIRTYALYIALENQTISGIASRFNLGIGQLIRKNRKTYAGLRPSSRLQKGTAIVLCLRSQFEDTGSEIPIEEDESSTEDETEINVDPRQFLETEAACS